MLVPEALAPRWCQHNTVRHRQPHTSHLQHRHKKISVYPSLSKDKETTTVIVADDEDLARERKQHQCGANAENREQSLYWVAIQQLPPEPLDDYNETTVMRYYNSYGEIVEEEDDSLCCKNIQALHHKVSPIPNSYFGDISFFDPSKQQQPHSSLISPKQFGIGDWGLVKPCCEPCFASLLLPLIY